MYEDKEVLFNLLPAYIRARDDFSGGVLKNVLLDIIREHAYLLELDIVQRMYDDWFIETCQDWIVPYIGDLLGYQPLPAASGDSRTQSGKDLAKILSPRREIGNLIAYRRRKGTLWVLEELARDVAGWPARAVEFYRLLSRAEHLDHPQPQRLATADLRDAGRLDRAGTPFDSLCRIVDVRRIGNEDSPGRHNIPNVGLFVFRTKRYSVTKAAAYCREDVGLHCFTFSILGNDAPLFRLPVPELDPASVAGETNFIVPIGRRDLEMVTAEGIRANDSLYGEGKSLAIYAPNWPKTRDGQQQGDPAPIKTQKVIPANLSDWGYQVPKNHVAVDPVLGRIQFPKGQAPRGGVLVSYGYGFPASIGGGEYERPSLPLPSATNHFRVSPDLDRELPEDGWFRSIDAAYRYWRMTLPGLDHDLDEMQKRWRPAAVFELVKSAVYKGRIDITLGKGELVCLMAGKCIRPVLWLSDENAGGPDSISIQGQQGSRVIFDGVLVTGRGVEIRGGDMPSDEYPANGQDLCEVVFRHSTLVPGWNLNCDCEPRRASEPSILVENSSARIRIESSIVGAIQINTDPALFDPTPVTVCDSIVDATADDKLALASPDAGLAYAELSISRSTIAGEVLTHVIQLAENSLFTAQVRVARRQEGCLRFSHVPAGSRTPRRYRCQPDKALATLEPETLSPAEKERLSQDIIRRAAPSFESTRYGLPNYMRLTSCAALEIKKGADDEAEMGVYHDLFEPQRLSLLTRRLEEFVPASTDSAVIFAS